MKWFFFLRIVLKMDTDRAEDNVHKFLRKCKPYQILLATVAACVIVTGFWKIFADRLLPWIIHQVAPNFKLPFLKTFAANNFFNSFVLNGIVLAVSIAVATIVNNYMLGHHVDDPEAINSVSTGIMTVGSGYISAFSAYYLVHICTGFGRGMFA